MVEHLRLFSETNWLTFNEQLNNSAGCGSLTWGMVCDLSFLVLYQ